MNEVKAAVDGTKNDIAKLNRTTTMVKILQFLSKRFQKMSFDNYSLSITE